MPSLESLHSRALIAAATQGDVDEVERLIPLSNCRFNGSLALREASKHNHTAIVKLLAPHSDTYSKDSIALRRAAEHGNVDLVTFLLPMSDPKAHNSRALKEAIHGNHKQVFDLLLPLSDITVDPDHFLSQAAGMGRTDFLRILLEQVRPQKSVLLKFPALNGYADCLEMLLPYCNPSDDDNLAWKWGLHNWNSAVVRALAPYVDVNIFNHEGLSKACENNDQELIELLFERCNRDTVFEDLINAGVTYTQIAPVEALLAQEQNQRMNAEIPNSHTTVGRKKM